MVICLHCVVVSAITTISDGAYNANRPSSPRDAPQDEAFFRRASLERRLDALDEQARHDAFGTAAAVRVLLDELTDADLAVAGRAHHVLGLALAHSDLAIDALAAMELGCDELLQAGERQSLGRLVRDLANLRGNQFGQTAEALEGYEVALSIANEVGSTADQGSVLNGMGVLFGRLERWDESERALRRAVELLGAGDVGTELGSAVNNLGYLLGLSGRHEEASIILSDALQLVDPARDPRTAMTMRISLAFVKAELGDFAGASQLLEVGDDLLNSAGTYLLVGRLDTLGRIHLRAGDSARAIDLLSQALALADAHELVALAVDSVRHLVDASELAGDLAAALAYERDLRRREREILDADAAGALRRAELTLQVEASNRENLVLEAARRDLAARVEERTADLRAEVEERRRAQESAARLSRVDWLTGLSNRRHFETLLRERLQADLPGVLGLLFVDLDHFKGVNDRYGHLAGDELLREAAVRLSLLVPPDALVARFGGDEFVVMLTMATVCEVDALAAQVVDAFATPLVVRQQAMQLTCSVGAAVHPDAAGGADNLMQRADTALLDAKHAGRSCWRRLDPAGWERATYSAHVMGELAGACDRGELSLAFQPQWRLSDGRCDAIEALLRWRHPTLGEISPSVFIPLAEDGGTIQRIGRWVLERACAAAVLIESEGHPALSDDWAICVNVSARQLQHESFSLDLRDVVAGSGWQLDRLELEVTESMQLSENDAVAASIAAVEAIGARFAIDDFGTGYASFGQLERLGASKLKLDRSLVQLLDEPAPRPSLPKAMIALGHSLGMVVTAEGVETQAQLQMLVTQGCDSVQGFAVGRPVSLALLAAELGRTEINGRSVSTR